MSSPTRSNRARHLPDRTMLRYMGVWAVAGAATLVAALNIAPGSLALWNDAASVDAGTISSGTLDAAIAPGTNTPTTDAAAVLDTLTDLIPGESRGATFTVRNIGNVSMRLSAIRADATNQYLILDLSAEACPTVPPAGVTLSSTPVNIGDAIAPDTNVTYCLRVTLEESAPASLQGAAVGPYGVDLTAGVP